MNDENVKDLPKIGYLYHYPTVDHPTDKFQLDIYISSIPTEKHFDVSHVILIVESQSGEFERAKITHPWEFQRLFHLCPGKIILEDRKNKKDEAFCFGGQLTINVKDQLTECVIVSPAPIIEINETRPMQVLFVRELEILLAEYRAETSDGSDFERHLCAVDPLDFYVACLNDLLEKYKQKATRDDARLEFLDYLHREEHRMQLAGLLKEPFTSLGEIFSSDL